MDLKATKEYGEIVSLLEEMKRKIETEIDKFQEESDKFSLEMTKEIIQYVTDFVKLKFNYILNDLIKQFDWFNIFIDCTDIDLNMNEIEALLRSINSQMKSELPEGAEPEIQIILKKYLRRALCKIPTKWTEPVILRFIKQFEETLEQLGVIYA